MVGQGRPIAWEVFYYRFAFLQIGRGIARLIFVGWLVALFWNGASSESFALEKTVRLRFAWGSGTAAKQRWTGQISIDGGVLTGLQGVGD